MRVMFPDQQLAQLFKRRFGTGGRYFRLTTHKMLLCPMQPVQPSERSLSWIKFSNITREVAENSYRRALILNIDVTHPDVEDFVTIKQDLKKVTGDKISVCLSEKFI